jgi:CcmD family protein
MNRYPSLALLIIFFLSLPSQIYAQPGQDVEMADLMRTDGKIYVVIAVLAVIFTGIVVYLVLIEKKLKKLEEKHQKK